MRRRFFQASLVTALLGMLSCEEVVGQTTPSANADQETDGDQFNYVCGQGTEGQEYTTQDTMTVCLFFDKIDDPTFKP